LTLARADTHFDAIAEPLSFYQSVSSSKEIRDASNDAESLVRDFGVDASMRLDVFNAKVAAERNIKASHQWEKLSAEERRLVEKMVSARLMFSPNRIFFIIKVLKLDLGWSTSWSGSSRRETQRVDGVAEGSSAGLLGIYRELNVPLASKRFDFGCQKNFNEENVSY